MEKQKWVENKNYFYLKSKKSCLGTILFIHGFNVYHDYFSIDQQLSEHFDYYAIDLPGHGKNTIALNKKEIKKKINLWYMRDFIIDFINQKNLDNIILIGHSMGGALVSLVAKEIPEKISKLVLISPMNLGCALKGFTFLKYAYSKNQRLKNGFIKTLYKDHKKWLADKEFNKICDAEVLSTIKRKKIVKHLRNHIGLNILTVLKVHSAMKQIKNKTFLLLGKHDGVVPFRTSRRVIRKAIKNTTVYQFDQSGHLCFHEEPEKTIKTIIEIAKK